MTTSMYGFSEKSSGPKVLRREESDKLAPLKHSLGSFAGKKYEVLARPKSRLESLAMPHHLKTLGLTTVPPLDFSGLTNTTKSPYHQDSPRPSPLTGKKISYSDSSERSDINDNETLSTNGLPSPLTPRSPPPTPLHKPRRFLVNPKTEESKRLGLPAIAPTSKLTYAPIPAKRQARVLGSFTTSQY